jgi:hypothetical protein
VKRTLAITAAVTLGLLGTLAVIGTPERWAVPETPPRQGEAVAVGDPTHHSPAALARLVREPQNTWSNLAFVLGGAWLISAGFRPTTRGLGLLLIAVGIGSFLYHASATRTLRHLDVGAMYWVFLLAALFSAAAWFERGRWLDQRIALFLLLTGIAAVLLTVGRNFRVLGFKPFALDVATGTAAAILLTTLAAVAWRARSGAMIGRAAVTVILFGTALACQIGDRPGGVFFSPGGLLQGHAVWHVLVAAAFVLAVHTIERGMPRPA